MEKEQIDKNLAFLGGLFEYSLKNGFADAVRYLGANSKQLISNLSFFFFLNAETKECFAFVHRKIKKSYLSFVLKHLKEFASKIGVDLNPSEFLIKFLPNGEIIGDDGPAQRSSFIRSRSLQRARRLGFLISQKTTKSLPERKKSLASIW